MKAGCQTNSVLTRRAHVKNPSRSKGINSRWRSRQVQNSTTVEKPHTSLCVFTVASYCSFIYTASWWDCTQTNQYAELCFICKHALFKGAWPNLFLQLHLSQQTSANALTHSVQLLLACLRTANFTAELLILQK